MRRIVLVVDESGEKGFSKKPEVYPGAFGVMSGYIFLEEGIEEVRGIFDRLTNDFKVNGKLHLTDLPSEQQDLVRKRVFSFFREGKVGWFYQAIYSQGHYQSIFEPDRGGEGKSERLHTKLFYGLFVKAVSRARLDSGDSLHIRIITDLVDMKTVREFQIEADHFINVLQGIKISRYFQSYDHENRKPIKTYVDTQVVTKNPASFKSLEYSIESEDSSLTFVADVLANSAHYYLKKKQDTNTGIDLNSRLAIGSHPLSDLVFIPYEEGQRDIFDSLYRRTSD
ncbi:hypothetical protein ACET8U_21870 [Aeromonas veronii]